MFSIWAYGKYSAVKGWLMSFAAWQLVWRWSRIARQTGQRDKRAASRSPIAAHLKPWTIPTGRIIRRIIHGDKLFLEVKTGFRRASGGPAHRMAASSRPQVKIVRFYEFLLWGPSLIGMPPGMFRSC
ncbi:MAG: hypothetical protein KGK16_12775 [Bradyrhizobium sp.]|nr:hypothetical protein [Bradyrhizobium sp.]